MPPTLITMHFHSLSEHTMSHWVQSHTVSNEEETSAVSCNNHFASRMRRKAAMPPPKAGLLWSPGHIVCLLYVLFLLFLSLLGALALGAGPLWWSLWGTLACRGGRGGAWSWRRLVRLWCTLSLSFLCVHCLSTSQHSPGDIQRYVGLEVLQHRPVPGFSLFERG